MFVNYPSPLVVSSTYEMQGARKQALLKTNVFQKNNLAKGYNIW
jgi:hypothetical protein